MENKNNSLVVLNIILIVLVLGLSSYLVYDKLISKDNKETNSSNNQTEENSVENKTESEKYETLAVNSDEVIKLIESININFIGMSDYFKKDKFVYSDYSNSDKLYLALVKKMANKSCYEKSLECSLTKTELENNLNLLFNDKSFEDVTTNLTTHGFAIAKEGDRYYTWSFGGGASSYKFIQNIVDARKYSDKIEIYEQNFLADIEDHYSSDSENKQYYYKIYKEQETDSEGGFKGKNLVATEYYTGWLTDLDSYNKTMFEKYKDQLYTYKYTFNYNKDTNTYYFVSVEKVK